MKTTYFFCLTILWKILFTTTATATIFSVNSLESFNTAHSNAEMNDSIIWESGIFSNIYMSITKSNLFIAADTLGGTVFNGTSRVKITGDYVTLQGFQFVRGNIGTRDVIETYGSYGLFTQINIRAYRSYKYLRIREQCQYVTVSHCNFENRLNLDDQNILSILVDANTPGYHKIQHCSFKNFDGIGNDMGIEPIRIGLSSQANRISRSLVEYCYFTRCNGDGEIISSKATQNVYRFNTFEDNPKAELVLRHGSEGLVYGNFFLDGKGGVRVREGQNHYIYNNYFWEIDDRPIYLQNESSDPLDSISIAFNTVIDSDDIRLGGTSGNYKPTNVVFANNIFTDPKDGLFENATGTETWIRNLAFGTLGITAPANGITISDPYLEENSAGFFGLSDSSPAINAAQPGYLALPQFPGMDTIDTDILFDLMGQSRPNTLAERDLGCNEFPHNIFIQPIATEENTGPSYNTTTVTGLDHNLLIVNDLYEFYPNPVRSQINIELILSSPGEIQAEIFNVIGQKVKTIFNDFVSQGEYFINEEVSELSAGTYILKVRSRDLLTGKEKLQTSKFVKQ